MSEDFWDTLKVATLVLKPALVALRYCDVMKGVTVTLLYNLLLKLDERKKENSKCPILLQINERVSNKQTKL